MGDIVYTPAEQLKFVYNCRELVVQFNADVADGMPWKFTPSQREVRNQRTAPHQRRLF